MTPGFKPFKKLIDEQILPDSGLACVQPPGEGGGGGGGIIEDLRFDANNGLFSLI